MTTSADRMRRLRERRAASIAADPDAVLRDADELLGPSVAEALGALGLSSEDAAAAKVVERYAAAIDKAKDPAWAMRWLGPLLLDALGELGATPAARARMTKGRKPASSAGPSRLDMMRSARAAADVRRGRP
jgi:hypothetical protein